MTASTRRRFDKLAVIGAGNMGSGIAQKMASEGFEVVLVDLDDEKVARGLDLVRRTLAEGVERRIFKPDEAEATLRRVRATADWSELADVDLVVEAVFEDLAVKREVFARLDEVSPPEAVLATNTSSLSVTELASATRHPERVLGLHYFYHPAKNRLVEVVPGQETGADALAAAWALQEQLGKTPIASADAPGFIVNRYFVPWLNEAVRLLEERVADVPTIEAACKATFGAGMGPFELMNVTGMPIALHAATTLGQRFGPFYAPAERLRRQIAAGEPWPLLGEPDAARFEAVERRMLAVVFLIAAELVDEKVGTIENTDIGARVGLRWPRGPFEMMNRRGLGQARELVGELCARWERAVPVVLAEQAAADEPFTFRLVNSEVRDGVAWLTINRPDALNALDETVVAQLRAAFRQADADPQVRGIVIGGAGKAFIAGADIPFFVRSIEQGQIGRIVEFTKRGHALLESLESSRKPVVARMHGLALGGGLELALACDRIVATPRAVMAFPETGIGIYPGLGGTQLAPRRVGVGLARWLVFTGELLPAERAAEIGLVDEVVPADGLDQAVLRAIDAGPVERSEVREEVPRAYRALAELFAGHEPEALRRGEVDTRGDATLERAVRRVGSKAPVALRLAGELIDASRTLSLDDGLAAELRHLEEIFGTEDALAGLSSVGRGQADFKGR